MKGISLTSIVMIVVFASIIATTVYFLPKDAEMNATTTSTTSIATTTIIIPTTTMEETTTIQETTTISPTTTTLETTTTIESIKKERETPPTNKTISRINLGCTGTSEHNCSDFWDIYSIDDFSAPESASCGEDITVTVKWAGWHGYYEDCEPNYWGFFVETVEGDYLNVGTCNTFYSDDCDDEEVNYYEMSCEITMPDVGTIADGSYNLWVTGETYRGYCLPDEEVYSDYYNESILGPDNQTFSSITLNNCEEILDLDEDGYTTDDCDDTNDEIYPGATEVCDGIDNNCDGVVDEGCQECTNDEECDDGNECTQNICNNYQCEYPNESEETECGSPRDCPNDTCNGFFAEFYPVDGHDTCDDSGNCIEYSCAMEDSYCTDNDPLDGFNTLECNAPCDQDVDCDSKSCSETYDDYCSGKKLLEYDDDKIMDNTTVTDSCDNACQSDCTCTDCTPDCSVPPTNTYCVKDVCGAECDGPEDCASGVCKSDCTCSESGGCPILRIYDGKKFVEVEKLGIHAPRGIDTVYSRPVSMKPYEYGKYKIILKEASYLLWEGSHMDNVKLLANGKECELESAVHSRHGNVLNELIESDDIRTETKPGEEISLIFFDCTGDEFTFTVEGYNPIGEPSKLSLIFLNKLIEYISGLIGLKR